MDDNENKMVDKNNTGGIREEHRLILLDRNGSGKVWHMLLNEDRNDFLSYKVHTEEWACLKNLTNFASIVVGNKLYIIGGFDIKTAKCVKRVWRYDPFEETWEQLADLPRAKAKHTCDLYEKGLLITGGEIDGFKVTASCEFYTPVNNMWSSCSTLPAPRANHAITNLNGTLYLSGGFYENRGHNNIWIYEHGKWHELDRDYPLKLQCKLDRHIMLTIDNSLHFIGGVMYEEYTSADTNVSETVVKTRGNMESFRPRVSYKSGDVISPWERKVTGLRNPRHSTATCVIGDKIFVFGGSTTDHRSTVNQTEYYDSITASWKEDFTLPKRKGDFGNLACGILKYTIIPEPFPSKFPKTWIFW